MPTYGLTSTGLVIKTLTDLKTEIENALKGDIGASLNLSAQSALGQVVGILSAPLAEVWEMAQAVHSAFDPDKASGSSLVSLAAVTGTLPLGATKSTVTITATGTAGTVLNTARVMSVSGAKTKFQTTASGTLAALTAWVASTAYVVGDRRTNSSRAYQCITAGTSAGSGGPTTTSADITDGTVHWRYLGEGAAAVDIAAEAQSTGPLPAVSGTLTVIETPVSGWQSVINVLDATLGRNADTDAQLRTRRENELAAAGKSPLDAIRAALLKVSGVTAAIVFQNYTSVTDANGLPPKSVECLVLGGTDVAVRAAVFANVAAGIETYGSNSASVTDSSGQAHTIKFSRPTTKDIYVVANIVKDPAKFPSDGSQKVKDQIKATGDATYVIGKDVRSWQLKAGLDTIAGLVDVTTLYIGLAAAPASEALVAIGLRELAAFDTSRITVNTSDATE